MRACAILLLLLAAQDKPKEDSVQIKGNTFTTFGDGPFYWTIEWDGKTGAVTRRDWDGWEHRTWTGAFRKKHIEELLKELDKLKFWKLEKEESTPPGQFDLHTDGFTVTVESGKKKKTWSAIWSDADKATNKSLYELFEKFAKKHAKKEKK